MSTFLSFKKPILLHVLALFHKHTSVIAIYKKTEEPKCGYISPSTVFITASSSHFFDPQHFSPNL